MRSNIVSDRRAGRRRCAYTDAEIVREDGHEAMTAAGLERQEDEPAPSMQRITRRFYERFSGEHAAFLTCIQGITAPVERARYATLMLNRLMFLYFIQRRGFLDGDIDYLAHRLRMMQEDMGAHTFYRHFLLPLLHEGLAGAERLTTAHHLFGSVPCLDGHLFAPHELERHYPALQIEDTAFERIFAFLDCYQWNLDGTLPRSEDEINPAILGHVFEQQVNQQQMGAYYTREDVTGYIASNTIIPYLFSSIARACPAAFKAGGPLWRLLQRQPDRYIYAPVRSTEPLPTETEREYAARHAYYTQLRARLAAGEIHDIDDLITCNLDIHRFALDALCNIDDAALLHTFYEQLQRIKILDPTCGSGAFLLAALHLLTPLYEACLERMCVLVSDHSQRDNFLAILEQFQAQPGRRHFILKSIISNNLYGVDIMEEATEICKLRLFLELAAQVERSEDLEPLPALGQHIRAGNALVGATVAPPPQDEQLFPCVAARFIAPDEPGVGVDGAINHAATRRETLPASNETTHHEANTDLTPDQRPFHWRAEFPAVFAEGGFNVIIGNPPYVEYSADNFSYKLLDFATLPCANLYPCVIERSRDLLSEHGRQGMIVPLAAFATRNMIPLIEGFYRWFPRSWLSFYHFRPAMLFSGGKVASIPTCIYLASTRGPEQRFSTHIAKWPTQYRSLIFPSLIYCRVTAPRDPVNRHYYPKFGRPLENALLEKVLAHTPVRDYLARLPNQNTMFYRSAGGLYWKVFTNFAWPYHTTSNKQRSFQEAYDRDIFVALFNSSLFWWYYTVTFDTFNLKDYMLFGFRFSYPEETETISALKALCQRLMDDFRRKAQHLKRGKTGSYTVYARKSKAIIDEIDCVLARHYGFTDEELDFIIHYDIKYRLGREHGL
jgi:hypothetical protein